MSRTVTGSAVRYAPERGHRSQRTPPMKAAASALGVAVPVGVVGVIGIGIDRALPIAAVTAVVTVLGVLLWRWTLPTPGSA